MIGITLGPPFCNVLLLPVFSKKEFCRLLGVSFRFVVQFILVKWLGNLFYSYFTPGLEVIKLFSCSAQLRLKFILLINVKMQLLAILQFISRINC